MLLEAVHERQHKHPRDEGPKNPAPPMLFDALLRWAHELDWNSVSALRAAGIKRTVAKAIRDGTAGWPTAAKLEAVLVARARELGRGTARVELMKAWADLGYTIATNRPELLEEMLDAARLVYERESASRPAPANAPVPPAPIEGIKARRKRKP
jgi:hypothetical protein